MLSLWIVTGSLLLLVAAANGVKYARRRAKSTRLRGPASVSLLYGYAKVIENTEDQALLFEQWSKDYGLVYKLPTPLGKSSVILMDPKAIAHIFGKDTYGYHRTSMAHLATSRLSGKGILWAEGDSHKRQRKTLTPGFSNVGIRNMTPVFYDSAYKLVAAWDGIFESQSRAVIDVQIWMNRISLDSIGLAGFSYDFGTLGQRSSKVSDIFDAMGKLKMTVFGLATFLLAPSFPLVLNLPTERNALAAEFKIAAGAIADSLMKRNVADNEREEMKPLMDKDDKSVLGLLVKSFQIASPGLSLTKDEVMAQIRLLILAGYETTSISLTWALIELAQHPAYQTRLRQELLSQFPHSDPTWDELTYGLPFLDAVVHETLRIHPSVHETHRQAHEDDVLPLSAPIVTASGEVADRIRIAKGTTLTVATASLQQSIALWGEDAKEFKPERWLDGGKGLTEKAKEVQGHRHLVTFIDGPRTCLGKNFAVAEFKAVLSVLVKNYSFEMRDGPSTQIGKHRAFLFRPKVKGESGQEMPLLVKKVE